MTVLQFYRKFIYSKIKKRTFPFSLCERQAVNKQLSNKPVMYKQEGTEQLNEKQGSTKWWSN